jgi:hypothetical protein
MLAFRFHRYRDVKIMVTVPRRLGLAFASARPTLADVERLARGEAATRRGIGSRQVPHRLNDDERTAYALAVKRGFAVVTGRGMRRERKGSPLLNTLRQRADALGLPMVWVERHDARAGVDDDAACVDLSPVRCAHVDELHEWSERCLVAARAAGGVPAPDQVSSRVVANTEAELAAWPIWALQPCVLRFVMAGGPAKDQERAAGNPKACKQLAAALVHALGTQLDRGA